ncbi:glycosyltransferase family 9 protein, partial [Candidatus Sumerlaeota bacterium]|nr:glycosyltransferase family 9 protein [Candidatus Sumerlaeota bacterium]
VLSGPSSSSGEPREILHQWILKVRPRLIFAPYLHEPWGSAFVRLVHSIRQPEIPIIGFDQDTGLARRLDQERIALRIHKVMQEHESRNLERLVAGEISSPGGAPRFEFPEFKSESRPAKIEPELGALERMKAWRAGLPPEKSGRPMLMLNPDAGYAQKEWPDESWAELIGLLSDALPHLFVMNFSKPHPQLEGLIAANPALKSRVEPLRNAPLENLIAAMSLCEGIVTVDSAPQHLAHALGVPSLTLYGPMDERRWGDRRGRPIHQTIRGGNFDLTPEELRGLPENHLMRLITPRKLGEKILEWKSSTRTGYIHHEVVK